MIKGLQDSAKNEVREVASVAQVKDSTSIVMSVPEELGGRCDYPVFLTSPS